MMSSSSLSTNGTTSSEKATMLPLRSESMAYPQVKHKTLLSSLQLFMRKHARAILATLSLLVFILILSSDHIHNSITNHHPHLRKWASGEKKFRGFGGAVHPGYFSVEGSIVDDHTFRFAAVTDMDQLSRVTDSSKPLFKSLLLPGTIKRTSEDSYIIDFEEERTLTSKHNEAGRGMELSELTIFNNRLLSFDDRTGTVFEILSKKGGKDSYVVPRFVITEGEGDTDKGMKWEWATVKGDELYMGSMGKEYTNPDGSVENTNNLWIAVMNSAGELRRLDWTANFEVVRKALGAQSPGYIMNEAVLWSPNLKKWVFMPRRISSEPYDENKDERRGSNKVVLVDEEFTDAQVIDVQFKDLDPLHGFSTMAFVPGTGDKHVLAIRTVEEDCVGGEESKCKQRTYFCIFDITTGKVLMDETKYSEDVKYEGVEFVNIYTAPPKY